MSTGARGSVICSLVLLRLILFRLGSHSVRATIEAVKGDACTCSYPPNPDLLSVAMNVSLQWVALHTECLNRGWRGGGVGGCWAKWRQYTRGWITGWRLPCCLTPSRWLDHNSPLLTPPPPQRNQLGRSHHRPIYGVCIHVCTVYVNVYVEKCTHTHKHTFSRVDDSVDVVYIAITIDVSMRGVVRRESQAAEGSAQVQMEDVHTLCVYAHMYMTTTE